MSAESPKKPGEVPTPGKEPETNPTREPGIQPNTEPDIQPGKEPLTPSETPGAPPIPTMEA